MVNLHLGCGKKYWDGWINVDILDTAPVQSDLRKLPFSDNYADVAVAIHVVEHFYAWEVPDMLTEWKRVLKPGGRLVLELPCMNKVIQYMADCLEKKNDMHMQMTWFAFWGDPGHRSEGMCHKWGYTKMQIEEVLVNAGFVNVQTDAPRYHFAERDMRVTAVKPLEAV